MGVCIRERLGVTSHSSPAAGGPDTVNTQRGIGGRWEAGSYRVEQKGSIPSVKAVRTNGAVSHIDSGMYRVEVQRFTSEFKWWRELGLLNC